MRIGIYIRSHDLKLPTINWLDENGFDSFEIYAEQVEDEYEDLSQREQLNMLLYDIEMGHLDAVYVDVLKIISPISVKVFQVLIEIQKLNVPIYFNTGKIDPSEKSIAHFHNLFITQWEKFRKDAASANFNKLFDDPNEFDKQL
jgi:DNA invertase Pin-like site-specific DNA recombinase